MYPAQQAACEHAILTCPCPDAIAAEICPIFANDVQLTCEISKSGYGMTSAAALTGASSEGPCFGVMLTSPTSNRCHGCAEGMLSGLGTAQAASPAHWALRQTWRRWT